jgi:hypothetical protein
MAGGRARVRMSQALQRLCRHAGVALEEDAEVHPSKNQVLMNALQEAWDGTPDRARKLARVIRALGDL